VSLTSGPAGDWLRYRLGIAPACTQTTERERACLARHAAGRRSLVELGVMYGVTTALLRSVMAPDGVLTGIDPHPRGRLFVSFERLIAAHEIARYPRGRAALLRQTSAEAAAHWTAPIDFLFIDADHSWIGIERDWREWTPHLVAGGLVALHDSRSVAGRLDLDSVRYTNEVVLRDPRFRVVDAIDSLTVLERTAPPSSQI
jgi:predicted O-methyltransferase YrrM